MITKRSLFGIACRAAAFSFLVAGSASLMQAQQSTSVDSSPNAPLLLASSSAPLDLTASSSSSSSSSSSDSVAASDGKFLFGSSALDSTQPPPRRRYGRPNYSDSHSNPDGSPKWTGLVGFGLGLPIGNTHKYETASWGLQAGFGRNFDKTTALIAQFDYDHFGLQGATLGNETYVDNYCTAPYQSSGYCTPIGPGNLNNIPVGQLDGNNHVWSFTLNPTFTLPTEGTLGAYVVAGGGFYHKVTNFTLPATGTYCDYIYGCYQYTANQVIDHYTSNAGGVNAGLGLTWKFAKFSNQRFYVDARYVVIFNEQRTGITPANVGGSFGATYTGTNYYPQNSNRTTYIPIKFGIRF